MSPSLAYLGYGRPKLNNSGTRNLFYWQKNSQQEQRDVKGAKDIKKGHSGLDKLSFVVNILLAIWALLELYTLARHWTPHTPSRDKGSMFVIGLTVALAFFLADSVNLWAKGWNFPIPLAIRVLGLVIMIGGMIFRFYSIRLLGRFFTPVVTFQPEQTLIQNGPYRYIRHPSYTGVWLVFIGLGLTTVGWIQFAVFSILPLLGLLYRIHVEERMLLQVFGSQYRQYAAHTRKLIPFLF